MRWYRYFFFVALVGATVLGTLSAQQSSVFEQAIPPARTDLERLNLQSVWQSHLPLIGRQDAVGPIQVVDDQQIFVQLRSGLLVALDANTGSQQWAFRYPSGYSTLHPVAVNAKYVFALNVNKIICLQRYTGLVEFEWEVRPRGLVAGQADGVMPSAAPVVDGSHVYIVTNGTEIMSYLLPLGVQLAPRTGPDGTTSVDAIARSYRVGSGLAPIKDEAFTSNPLPPEYLNPPGEDFGTAHRTPSLTILPTVAPPYTLYGRKLHQSPSLAVIPSMRQPYQFRSTSMRYNQATPSISAIPPSVARVHEYANLRPPMPAPKPFWVAPFRARQRLQFAPVMVDADVVEHGPRIWLPSVGTSLMALSRANGALQVDGRLQDNIVSPLAGPALVGTKTLLGYLALEDGNVLAIDLMRGTRDTPLIEWRTAVGGRLNHRPLATTDSVFVSGERAGTAKIDVTTGELIWKTEPTAENVLAVNSEFVYIQDQYGDLLVYDRKKATEPGTRRSRPLTKLDLTGFTRPVMNDQTDRIVLASDSGLMICLRDSSVKYAKPMNVAPASSLPKPAAPKEDAK